MPLAVLGGTFLEPDPLTWLFGSGIGSNIGASIIWGFLAGLLGVFLAKRIRKAWRRLHGRLDDLHARHDDHHVQLEGLAASVAELHLKLEPKPPARKPAARRSAKPKA